MTRHAARLAAVYAALLSLCALLLGWNLSDRYLWEDEAETATLALAICEVGWPEVSQRTVEIRTARDWRFLNDDDLWVASPWLDEYLAATSLGLFGRSAWAARLPFVIVGWLSACLVPWAAWRIYRSQSIALTATVLYVSSVPLYTHARQCRYYALLLLAQVVIVLGFGLLAEGRRWRGGGLLAAGLTAQFYSNYLLVACNVPALLLAAFFARRQSPGLFVRVCGTLCGVALLAAPWLWYAQGRMTEAARYTDGWIFTPQQVAHHWTYYLSLTNDHLLPLVVPIAGGAWLWRQRRRRASNASNAANAANAASPANAANATAEPSLIEPAIDAVAAPNIPPKAAAAQAAPNIPPKAAAAAPAAAAVDRLLWLWLPVFLVVLLASPLANARYMVTLLPAFALLTAVIVNRAAARTWLRVALVGVLAFTSWAARPWRPAGLAHWPLVEFARELRSDYIDRIEAVSRYLEQHSQPGQTLYSLLDELPILFYTQLEPYPREIDRQRLPDWILLETVSTAGPERTVYTLADFAPGVQHHYEAIEVAAPDTPGPGTLPSPQTRAAFTVGQNRPVVLYRLKGPPAAP